MSRETRPDPSEYYLNHPLNYSYFSDVYTFFYLLLRNTRCNSIRGATEATVFPSKLDEHAVFRVFRKAFCRPIPIVFKKKVKQNGLPAFQYTIPDNFADPPEMNPDNECFCRSKECLKKGLLDLTPCYYSEYFFVFL